MSIVKTSFRALLWALLPLFLVHGVLFAMALLGSQTNPPMIVLPAPDRALGLLLLRIAPDAVLLIAGHFVCRGLGMGSRAAYALMGGIAGAAGYWIALQCHLLLLPPPDGTLVTAGILPMLAGMTTGFLYGQFAGREQIVTQSVTPSSKPAAQSAAPAAFVGPVQVRTSVAAMFMASLIPAILIALLFFTLTYGLVSGVHDSPGEPMTFDWSRQILALALPAQMFLSMALMTMVPSAILVAIAHALTRAMRRTSGLSYAGTGALVGLALGVVLIPFGGWPSFPFNGVSFLILPLAAFGAIMMAVYRRFAGLEPRASRASARHRCRIPRPGRPSGTAHARRHPQRLGRLPGRMVCLVMIG